MTDYPHALISVRELEEAWQRLLSRGHIPASVSELYDAVLTKRNMTEDKAELFARIWGKGVERKGVIDGSQTIKHSELIEALMHLGWDSHPAMQTAYNITSRVLDEREPKFKTGDIVRSGDHRLFKLEATGRWKNLITDVHFDTIGPRPLTKIGVST